MKHTKLFLNRCYAVIAGLCFSMTGVVWAQKTVDFDFIMKAGRPPMGDLSVQGEGGVTGGSGGVVFPGGDFSVEGKGCVTWSTVSPDSVTGEVSFSSFKYAGSIKNHIKQKAYTCSFEKTNQGQIALLLSEGAETGTDTMASVQLSQQYTFSYYVLESLFIASSVDGASVTYPESFFVTSNRIELQRKRFSRAPDTYTSLEIKDDTKLLKYLDTSGPMIRFFKRVFDAKGNLVTSLDFRVEKKYYSDNSLEFCSDAASFEVHIPSNSAYIFNYFLINVD